MKFIKIIWNDPVWSKVIAAGVLALIPTLISAIKSIVSGITMPYSIYLLLVVPVVMLITYVFIFVKRHIHEEKENGKEKIVQLLDHLAKMLCLNSWDVFIDNALRGIVAEEFVNNQRNINMAISTFIWPKHWNRVRKYILLIISDYNKYVDTFSRHCYHKGNVFREDYFYKSNGFNPNYDSDLIKYNRWIRQWYIALHNFVLSLNKFIKIEIPQIRNIEIPPEYAHLYTLEDTMGVYNNAVPTIMNPTKRLNGKKEDAKYRKQLRRKK